MEGLYSSTSLMSTKLISTVYVEIIQVLYYEDLSYISFTISKARRPAVSGGKSVCSIE